VFKSLKNETDLVGSINEFAEELKNNNVEIFEQKNNILITEKGCQCFSHG